MSNNEITLLKEELSPHQCTKFYSEEKEEKSKLPKTKSLMKLKPNFEAKFFLEKKSNKGRTLIGLTDLSENFFENDEYHVWTFVIGSGEKYSSEKRLEKFYDNDQYYVNLTPNEGKIHEDINNGNSNVNNEEIDNNQNIENNNQNNVIQKNENEKNLNLDMDNQEGEEEGDEEEEENAEGDDEEQ